MPFIENDYVEFHNDANEGVEYYTRGRVLLEYTPPRNLGGRAGGYELVRMDAGHGGWDGEDGYYYWYVKREDLRYVSGHGPQYGRPISPIFYEVRL